jgi:hypothetical protein
MEILHIPATPTTPLISFNSETGVFEISGKSTHENPVVFYEPVIQWLHDYSKMANNHTSLLINLMYFNTSSSKCLLDVFRKMKQIKQIGGNVVIKWQYEPGDEDMQEAGADYAAILELPFEFIEQA